jgi:hypothetical protein
MNAAHKTNLNDNNSRLLGNGEPVFPGVYWRLADLSAGETWNLIDANLLDTGLIVDHDGDFEYRQPLTIQGRESFSTGAVRNQQAGRGRFDLIPFEAMLAYAQRLEYGIQSGYEPNNWQKGMPLSRILSSMRRHASQINFDFTEDHIGAVLFNAGAFVTIVTRIKAGRVPRELDDIGYIANTTTHSE